MYLRWQGKYLNQERQQHLQPNNKNDLPLPIDVKFEIEFINMGFTS